MSVDPSKDGEWMSGGFGELISEPAKPRCFRWESPRDPDGLPMIGVHLFLNLDSVVAWGIGSGQLEVLVPGLQYVTRDPEVISRWQEAWEIL